MIEIKLEGPWDQVNKFFRYKNKKYRGNVRKLFDEMERDVAETVLERVKKRIGGVGEERQYRDSLELVKVKGEDELAVFSNPKYVRVDRIDPKVHVIVLKAKKGADQSDLARSMVHNSPFVMGLLTQIPRSLDIMFRRTSPQEVDKAKERNGEVIKGILRELKKVEEGELRPIKYIRSDIEFFAIRLEKGYAGFKKKPHWVPVIKDMDVSAVLTGSTVKMFADMKKPNKRPRLESISEKRMSDTLATKVLAKYTEEIDKDE